MDKDKAKYQAYVKKLKDELIPAMGCTEPISLAYAAAIARETLGCLPQKVELGISGSIIKNVKSVVVPNTGGMRGIKVAASAGLVAGDAKKELEVIADVPKEKIDEIKAYIEATPIKTEHIDNGYVFEIIVTVYSGDDYAKVRIVNQHTNVVLIEKNGEKIKDLPVHSESDDNSFNKELLNIEAIYDFANTADISEVKEILDRQIQYNLAIATEGANADYGANIGRVLLNIDSNDIRNKAKAMAAAGSDARMNGCEMPVIINSGSGNQGITVSVPVITYFEELGLEKEKLYRALLISNLVAIRLKTPIGRLSAYCGAVTAGAAAGAGIAYLKGGDYNVIKHTIVNALAIVSGIVCDGAKSSCAGKIAIAVDAGILGYEMFMQGEEFHGGDGIVAGDVEKTIENIGRLAKKGMYETNEEIIEIMTED